MGDLGLCQHIRLFLFYYANNEHHKESYKVNDTKNAGIYVWKIYHCQSHTYQTLPYYQIEFMYAVFKA